MTTKDSRRPGRRPGGEDTRAQILDAARRIFAERGLRGTTVRAVADQAGCDPALVHHYFGSKQDLFLAAVEIPVDPELVRTHLREAPFETLGGTLAAAVLTLWHSPVGEGLAATFRTVLADDRGEVISDFLLSAAHPVLLERLRDREPAITDPDAERRIALTVTQLIGAVVGRRFLRMPALTALGVEELAEAIGPTLQRHLEGRTD
ncbi:TetR family transcriptional regulator [Dietzia sp. 179-F 9C3 NHS]|uniref:TetR/AcrR family transcriptional regulator n=1 Tax=Dietzia sp. 179-F 9C3 NHS TaxID=3374295 RepID=UPI0038799652